MKESILYYLVKTLAAIIRALPVTWALALGRAMGVLTYYFYPRRRRQVIRNIKIGLAAEWAYEDINRLSFRVFKNYAQNIVELLRLPGLSSDEFDKYVEVQGMDNLDTVLSQGNGVMFLSMHLGNWELGSLVSRKIKRPYSVVMKKQRRLPRLDALLQEYRSTTGAKVIDRDGMGLRNILRCLKNNEVVGIVGDQGGPDGFIFDFLNTRSSFPAGPIRIALQQKVPILFASMHRRQGPYHTFTIEPPLEFKQTGDIKADTAASLSVLVEKMEATLREYPAEYMWFYKYWKYGARRSIVILYDDKTGHLRQSQTVAQLLKEKLKARGLDVLLHEVKIEFRSEFREILTAIWSRLRWRTFGPGEAGFLRMALTEESFQRLTAVSANYVISAGAHLAWVNAVIGRDNGAFMINLLQPGMMSAKAFHLNIFPRHDVVQKTKAQPNVILTKGAPNLIDTEYLNRESVALVKRFSHLRNPSRIRLGVLIGGETALHMLPQRLVRMVINQLKEITTEFSAEILLTTSRRTSAEVETMLVRELKKFPGCSLLIIANTQNVPEAVGGILGLCDVVIVSGDSISMISEAATSGKQTIVFPVPPREKMRRDKHREFIDALHDDGHIYCSQPQSIKHTVLSCIKQKVFTKPLADRAVIEQALEKIL